MMLLISAATHNHPVLIENVSNLLTFIVIVGVIAGALLIMHLCGMSFFKLAEFFATDARARRRAQKLVRAQIERIEETQRKRLPPPRPLRADDTDDNPDLTTTGDVAAFLNRPLRTTKLSARNPLRRAS